MIAIFLGLLLAVIAVIVMSALIVASRADDRQGN